MGELIGMKKPKVSKATQQAQRRQAKSIDDQTADAAKEAGSRNRIMRKRQSSGGNLFSRGGAVGVSKDTLGG